MTVSMLYDIQYSVLFLASASFRDFAGRNAVLSVCQELVVIALLFCMGLDLFLASALFRDVAGRIAVLSG